MSAVEPIKLQLTAFEKLQILRDQLEDRQQELEEVESNIKDMLSLSEKQRYLEGLSPFYAANPVPDLPSAEQIQALEQHRAQLVQLIKTIEDTIPATMDAANQKGGGQAAPSAPSKAAGPARKVKFDSFEDFAAGR